MAGKWFIRWKKVTTTYTRQ